MFKLRCCECGNEMTYKQGKDEIIIENDTIYFDDDNHGNVVIECENCCNSISESERYNL